MLLAPPDGATFDGADTVILLNWASVGILDEDEWYVLHLRWMGAPAPGQFTDQPPLVWTKTTSWRLPAELYTGGMAEPQRFRWQVSIMRQTGDDHGTWLGDQISPDSITRTFTWH